MSNFRNTISGSITANDASVTLPYRYTANGAVAAQVTGTFSGTLQFEVTVDGTNFVAARATNVTSGTAATTTTAGGVFTIDATGVLVARVRSTAWSSGTADVTLVSLPNA